MKKFWVISALCLLCMEVNSQVVKNAIFNLSKSEEEALIKEYGQDVFRAAKAKNITTLMLDIHTTLEMGVLCDRLYKDLREIELSSKSTDEKRAEKKKRRIQHQQQVRKLIGEDKFSEWQHYTEMWIERKYMEKFGFTESQIAAYSHEMFKATETEEVKMLELSPELALMLGKILIEFKSEKKNIKNQSIDEMEKRTSMERLRNAIYGRIEILIGEDKFQIWKSYQDEQPKRSYKSRYGLTDRQIAPYSVDACVYAERNEIGHLGLDPLLALKMGELKAKHEKSIKALPKGMSGLAAQKRKMENQYRQSVKELIGNEKFLEWIVYIDGRLERKYIKEFGFTSEHFKLYQDLENRQAVTILRIKNSPIPKEEKNRRIQDAKDAKVKDLRKSIPSAQFEKWYKEYLRKEKKTEK